MFQTCGRMEIQDIIINSFITMFSLGLLVISLATYKNYKNPKLLFITAVFVVFSIKAIIISLGLFHETVIPLIASSYFRLFDLIILLLLFIAVLKR